MIDSRKLTAFVALVGGAAVAALLTLPTGNWNGGLSTLILLAVVSALAGLRPVRLASMRVELTATHPIVLCALALLGPIAAVLTAVAGVAATALVDPSSRRAFRLPFNLAAVVLATCAASWTFVGLRGDSATGLEAILWPLAAATTVYFLVNTGLVSAVIAVESRKDVFGAWSERFSGTVASYLSAFTLAALLLVLVKTLGPWGLVLAIPPCWVLIAFYRTHRERVQEKQLRIDEVERLNGELQRTVVELQDAAAHVKRLQGLIPICMHCKSIRDDHQMWHRIENYLAEHSEAEFTHSLCETCRDKHYPQVESASTTR